MDIDFVTLLKNCKIFSSLNNNELKKLQRHLKKVTLRKNQILFHRGDIGNHLYVLVSGKLIACLTPDNIIAEVHPGETTGEMGAMTHEPRSATVKAVEKSILLELSSIELKKLCQRYPAVLFEIMNNLLGRSRSFIEQLSHSEKTPQYIAIIGANKKTSLQAFSKKIKAEIKRLKNIVMLIDTDNKITKLSNYLDKLEKKHTTIIFVINKYNSSLAKICFEKTNNIYVVGDADAPPHISSYVLTTIKNINIKTSLILLHKNKDQLPKHSLKWLQLANFQLHHHLCLQYPQDIQRILRFMRGVPIGLVLGGGGLRCWAHYGAILALFKKNIPIDAIGGTSAGAIVAAYHAMFADFNYSITPLQELSEITRKSASVFKLTYPAASVFNSKSYTQKLQEIYGSAHIENLWLPAFFVGCNLSDGTQAIYTTGSLWRKIRSSTAVPAIFAPVVIRGKIHLDGGVINNLPVDIMKKILGLRSTVIAVELTHQKEDNTKYNFPPILTFWKTLLAKTGIAYKNYKFPPFVDTFLKSLLAGSATKQKQNSLDADILITPDLSSYRLLAVTLKQQPELIKIGYASAVKALKHWKKLHKK